VEGFGAGVIADYANRRTGMHETIDKLTTWIAHRKYEVDSSWGYGAYIFQIFSFETFAMVFCDKFGISGATAGFVYCAVPPLGFVGMIITGQIMIRAKLQEKYSKICADQNPDWLRVIGRK